MALPFVPPSPLPAALSRPSALPALGRVTAATLPVAALRARYARPRNIAALRNPFSRDAFPPHVCAPLRSAHAAQTNAATQSRRARDLYRSSVAGALTLHIRPSQTGVTQMATKKKKGLLCVKGLHAACDAALTSDVLCIVVYIDTQAGKREQLTYDGRH